MSYFPVELCAEAHIDHLNKTKHPSEIVEAYCKNHHDFFYDVVFAYIDKEPYPVMRIQQ